jgi:translation initiation factor 2-alpha kinase 3
VAFELLFKFNTRMERLHTLQQLKQGEFPADFGKAWGMKVGEAMKECIGFMLAQDGNVVSAPELKQKLTAILSMREHAASS